MKSDKLNQLKMLANILKSDLKSKDLDYSILHFEIYYNNNI